MKRGREEEGDQLDIANCLMLLNKVGEIETNPLKDLNDGAFECKTCNRKFSSFQALGGHRASHKKTKLLVSDLSSCHNQKKLANSTTRMHPCPICGHEFAIGQALGGHMRKHRAAINHGLHALPILKKMKEDQRSNLCLDLNLAPPENDLNKLNLHIPSLKLNCFI